MAHEWNIKPRSGACAVCGRAFEAGEECVSALFNAPDAGFERRDYCVGCWDKRPDGDAPFSQWQGAYAPPRGEQARKEPIAHETAEDLLRRLIDIGDPANVNGLTLFTAAHEGDGRALMVLDKFTTYLAIGVADLINIFQPDVLCIGGGISKQGDFLIQPLVRKVEELRYTKHSKKQTQICAATLGNDAGIIGAALLSNVK